MEETHVGRVYVERTWSTNETIVDRACQRLGRVVCRCERGVEAATEGALEVSY